MPVKVPDLNLAKRQLMNPQNLNMQKFVKPTKSPMLFSKRKPSQNVNIKSILSNLNVKSLDTSQMHSLLATGMQAPSSTISKLSVASTFSPRSSAQRQIEKYSKTNFIMSSIKSGRKPQALNMSVLSSPKTTYTQRSALNGTFSGRRQVTEENEPRSGEIIT